MSDERRPPRAGSRETPVESVEALLSRAFAPVDPPPRLLDALDDIEDRLERISQSAIEELADWELAAMHDPRNWVRPAAAVVGGAAAAGALVVLGLRTRRRGGGAGGKGGAAVRGLNDALTDVVREVDRSTRRWLR